MLNISTILFKSKLSSFQLENYGELYILTHLYYYSCALVVVYLFGYSASS